MNIAELFEHGGKITASQIHDLNTGEYVPHKSFKGVSLKLLAGGNETGHAVSLHLVRVEPNCCLDTHEHLQNLEIHKVIHGSGCVVIGDSTGEYKAGSIGVIPMGTSHKVTAGADGIYLLATFSPALA